MKSRIIAGAGVLAVAGVLAAGCSSTPKYSDAVICQKYNEVSQWALGLSNVSPANVATIDSSIAWQAAHASDPALAHALASDTQQGEAMAEWDQALPSEPQAVVSICDLYPA